MNKIFLSKVGMLAMSLMLMLSVALTGCAAGDRQQR